jgi:hypothetical protein
MSEVKTNREFMKTLARLCDQHNIDTDFATQRQASKYRNKKGRVYNKIQSINQATKGGK